MVHWIRQSWPQLRFLPRPVPVPISGFLLFGRREMGCFSRLPALSVDQSDATSRDWLLAVSRQPPSAGGRNAESFQRSSILGERDQLRAMPRPWQEAYFPDDLGKSQGAGRDREPIQ